MSDTRQTEHADLVERLKNLMNWHFLHNPNHDIPMETLSDAISALQHGEALGLERAAQIADARRSIISQSQTIGAEEAEHEVAIVARLIRGLIASLIPSLNWFCACGWKGTPDEMTANEAGIRTCPKCGASGGLASKEVPSQRELGSDRAEWEHRTGLREEDLP